MWNTATLQKIRQAKESPVVRNLIENHGCKFVKIIIHGGGNEDDQVEHGLGTAPEGAGSSGEPAESGV